jgi:predicted nuclease of predicted toxin-antitoxin system
MRFLADENFPRPALLALREAGNDLRSVTEDSPGLSDEEVAELCEQDQRVLLTFDKDFGEMVFRRGLSAGAAIVLFRFVPKSAMEALEVFHSLIKTGVLVPGVFCVVTRDKVRTRQLRRSNRGAALTPRSSIPRDFAYGIFG